MMNVGRRTVLLVEDHALMRVLVAESLEVAGFTVSAHAHAAPALAQLDEFDPDALVTDIDLGERPDGAELAMIVRKRSPHVAIVFLTNFPQAASAPRIVASMPDAIFVHKGSLESGSELTDAVDAALRRTQQRVSAAKHPADEQLAMLTRSQLETLSMLAEGLSNAEIARRSGRSVRAVERLLTRMFEALGVNSNPAINPRVAAATRYVRTFGVPVAEATGE